MSMRTNPSPKLCRGAISILPLLAMLLLSGPAHGQNQPLVIDGGTLIDGTGGAPLQDAVIVVEGNRIRAVGKKGSVAIPAQAKVIRGDGMTILPGLIDSHIHELDFFPPLFPHFGVTTVYDTANPTEWSLAQREAFKSGKIKGPRMFITGVVLDGPVRPGAADRRSDYLVNLNTPEEARAKVRELIRSGVDLIKVYQYLQLDQLKAIMDEVHKAGLEAAGHSHDARDDIAAGLKFIEHSTPIAHATLGDPAKVRAMDEGRLHLPEAEMDEKLFDPLIQELIQSGVYYNPTITREWINVLPKRQGWYDEAGKLLRSQEYAFIPAERREYWLGMVDGTQRGPAEDLERERQGFEKVKEFTRRFAQAGGKVLAGTDAGPSSQPSNMPGLALHVEMEQLVDTGLTPMQAILSATKWAAEFAHKENDLGTVEPGKLADIILIEGNPLADIRATRNVRTVIMDGKVADTKLDPSWRNPIPRPTAEYSRDYRGPEVSGIAPEAVRAGAGKVEIEITGRKFQRTSVIRFDMTNLPTKFVNANKLTATVDAGLLRNAGTFAVTVTTPGSGGGTSREVYLIVKYPN